MNNQINFPLISTDFNLYPITVSSSSEVQISSHLSEKQEEKQEPKNLKDVLQLIETTAPHLLAENLSRLPLSLNCPAIPA